MLASMRTRFLASLLALAAGLCAQTAAGAAPFVVYRGGDGPGQHKKVVFLTGDEEYRSEESMPQLARILAKLGCRCTVLFAIDPKTGAIDPGVVDNIPGMAQIDDADLLVVFTRFRNLPAASMRHFVSYVESGRPIVGLRTATHAFAGKDTPLQARWAWDSSTWDGGFGRQVLGETWIAHHGEHGSQGTLGVLAKVEHPILRGLAETGIWDPADVYKVRLPLPDGCETLVFGQVLGGVAADTGPAPARVDAKTGARIDPNAPMQPIAWTRTWTAPNGKPARVFTTTLGSAEAFTAEGTRRLLVNGCLWALGLDAAIAPDLDVALVGDYAPSPFGFGKHRQGVTPWQLEWPRPAAK